MPTFSVWVNYSSSKNIPYGETQWRVPFIVQMVPGVIFVVLMLFQPESPRWLVEHEQYERAAATLAFVARTSIDDKAVLVTMEEIKADFVGRHQLTTFQQFKKMGESRATAIRCFIPSLVMFFQQWTGTNAINYFSPQIFAGLGITGTTADLFATGIYGVVKVVFVALTLAFAVESFGRKKCFIVGGLGQAAAMLWIGGYSGIHKDDTVDAASYVSIVAVYLYAVFFCFGWGPMSWVIAGEVAPNHVRAATLSIAVGVNWLFSITISKLTPIMLDSITYGTFLLFGSCCLVMATWAYFCLPETSGHALEDVKYLFENDMFVRALEDAPGGWIFLAGKSSVPVVMLRRKDEGGILGDVDDSNRDVENGCGQAKDCDANLAI
jgi:sugar porter (SP) family MFS transporter